MQNTRQSLENIVLKNNWKSLRESIVHVYDST